MKLWMEIKRRYRRYKLASWCCWARPISPFCYLMYSKEKCERIEREVFEWAEKFIEEYKREHGIE